MVPDHQPRAYEFAPVLVHRHRNWQRISAAAVVCYRWDGRRVRLYFHHRPGSFNEASLIEFLRQLRRHFYGQRLILLWDGLTAHRSRGMRAYIESQARWLGRSGCRPTRLSSIRWKGLWATSRAQNWPTAATWRSGRPPLAAYAGVQRVRSNQQLLFGFLGQTGPSF